jgi:hypothetical protein
LAVFDLIHHLVPLLIFNERKRMKQSSSTAIITGIVFFSSFLFLNVCEADKNASISDEVRAINPLEYQTWVPTPKEREYFPQIQEPEEVRIGHDVISMPLGRILLVRKGAEYCALKFTNNWLSKTPFVIAETDIYTSYEFYYQGDGSGDFSKGNVKTGTNILHLHKVSTFLGYPYFKNPKTRIRCGGIELKWMVISTILLEEAELAPTPWRSINEVDINDPRIEWYRKGAKNKRLPIDQLWKGKGR